MVPREVVDRFQSAARARYATGRAITAVTVAVAAVSLVVTSLALFEASRSLPEYFRLESAYKAREISWQEYLMAAQHMNVVQFFVLLYLGLYVLPFIVALPVAAAIVLLWRDPPGILVLRPFNRRPLTRGLARLVHRDIARFGHVYTLADAELRVRWYVRVPFLLGQLALLSFRARTIRKLRQLERLDRATRRSWLRNINWCLSWRKVFAVASDDEHWQQVVERLVRHANVILIDLTEARANVLWEIALIDRLGLRDRVLWLMRAGDPVENLPLAAIGIRADDIYRYDEKGGGDGVKLRAAMAARIADDRFARQAHLRRGRLLSILALVMFIGGCFPLLALWSGPISERFSRADYAGVSIALWIVGFGLLTWLVLGIAALRNRNAVFFVAVQVVLLAGALLVGG